MGYVLALASLFDLLIDDADREEMFLEGGAGLEMGPYCVYYYAQAPPL